MTSLTISKMLGDINNYVYNPAAIQSVITNSISKILDGEIDLVDATNPFVLALEMSSCNTAAACQHNAALTRRLYPAAATTFSDLYYHMSDTDYLNMFALPASASFTILLQYEQLINALILDPATGISQITIPRNTTVTAAGVVYSLQYPINIRKLQHGGLQIAYDATVVSPLQTLDNNIISLSVVAMPSGSKYVKFDVLMQQFFITTIQNDVSASSGMVTNIPLTDNFYYARVYSQNVNGTWTEIATTYTDQIYDISKPTAVLVVTEDQVTVTIPPVYTINQIIRGKIRIDVYQTKGPQSTYLGAYSSNDFISKWYYIDQNDATPETAAITKINNLQIYSTDTATGGRYSLTFEQMRQRVIANSIGPRQIPINPAQIQDYITDDGYTIVKEIDTLTNRQFWATKSLPSPSEVSAIITNNVYSAANASMLSLLLSISEASNSYGCTVHATGMTITSDALFKTVNGVSTLVSNTQYQQISNQSLTEKAETFNTSEYYYTPFYYVLDNGSEIFDVRPYYLDTPSINSRSFIQENATTGLQVSIGSPFSVVKTSVGYLLSLTTVSNSAYQDLPDNEVFCQISFKNTTNADAFMLGTQLVRVNNTGERTFTFSITTEYDINSDNFIDLTSFDTGNPESNRSSLDQVFNVLFSTTTTMPGTFSSSTIDSLLGNFQLPAGAIGITYEKIDLHFGDYLETLWNNYRSFSSDIPFQTYAQDIPAYYLQNVYLKDNQTGAEFSIVNDQVVFTIQHAAGDPILDANGNPTYVHRVGDYIVNPETGLPQPIPGYETALKRSVDIFVLNAVYRFANDPITVKYLSYVNNALLTWLTQDLVNLNTKTLDQTEISFYPSVSQGYVDVTIENNVLATIPAAQALEFTLYVPTETNNNSALLATLVSTTIKTTGEYLASATTVSVSELLSKLRDVYGSDVADVVVKGFGGIENNYSIMTIKNSSTRLSINKVLAVQTNNQTSVQEDVKVSFVIHDVA